MPKSRLPYPAAFRARMVEMRRALERTYRHEVDVVARHLLRFLEDLAEAPNGPAAGPRRALT